MLSRARMPALTPSGSAALRDRGLKWLVVAAAIDLRHFRSHGAQIRRQLAAVVDAVIVEELQIESCRQVENTKELDGGEQLGRSQGTNPSGSTIDVAVVPGDEVRNVLGLFLRCRSGHGELQVGNAVEELNIRVSE